MERYKNKWFRLSLEKDLKNEDLGVNIHCKEDGLHITVPPPITNFDDMAYRKMPGKELHEYPGMDNYVAIEENQITKKIVNKIENFVKDYEIKVDLEKAIYGDNIKIKLNVKNG